MEEAMTLEAVNTPQTGRMDIPASRPLPDGNALHMQDELLELLQSLMEACADLRFRLGQVEARERIRDAIRKPRDLGIDY
jgi:hypothetical protein